MTLTTHYIVGVATARLFSFNPVVAFLAAFVSHFLIDAIPHWDYHLKSAKTNLENPLESDMLINRDFIFDFGKIAFDAILGALLSFIIFQPSDGAETQILIFGVVGGILPDPLQFLYYKFRHEPLISLQKFHLWIHTKRKLENKLTGIFLQFLLVLVIVIFSFMLGGFIAL